MTNGSDEQNQTAQEVGLPEEDHLRNRMRFQAALHSELAKKVDWLMQSEQDLLKIFRFYLIVLGAFISILSILANQGISVDALLNVYTASAVLFWVIAVVGAIVAYIVIWSSPGINEAHQQDHPFHLPKVFEHKKEAFQALNLSTTLERPAKDFEDEMIYNYVQSLHRTGKEFRKVRYPFLWSGMALVAISVLVFGVGVFASLDPRSRILVRGGTVQTTPLAVHAVGITVLVSGAIVSRFLLRQTVAQWERIQEKIETSAASDLPTVYGFFLGGVSKVVGRQSTTGTEGFGMESPTEWRNESGTESKDETEEASPEASTEGPD